MSSPSAVVLCSPCAKQHFATVRSCCLEMFNGDDVHALSRQITGMLETDLEFRAINHLRGLCNDAGLRQNGMIHALIDDGFIARQVLTIRRITEKYPSPKDREVYSLPRIIGCIEEIRGLLTREVYVCFDGAPYTDEIGNVDARTFVRQCTFDEMTGLVSESRDSQDRIPVKYFESLRERLRNATKSAVHFSHKFMAHAADPSNRKGDLKLTLDRLEEAYKVIVSVANSISINLLADGHHQFVPMQTADPLAEIDQPICPSTLLSQMRAYWEKRQRELEKLDR